MELVGIARAAVGSCPPPLRPDAPAPVWQQLLVGFGNADDNDFAFLVLIQNAIHMVVIHAGDTHLKHLALNRQEARQKKQRAANDQKCNRAGMAADHKIDDALQPPARILGINGLARRAKSRSLVGIAHRFRIR